MPVRRIPNAKIASTLLDCLISKLEERRRNSSSVASSSIIYWSPYARRFLFIILVYYLFKFSRVDPSEIGTLCEELVGDYDSAITSLLKQVSDGSKKLVEEEICVKTARICSKKEFKKVMFLFAFVKVDSRL